MVPITNFDIRFQAPLYYTEFAKIPATGIAPHELMILIAEGFGRMEMGDPT